MAPQTFQPVGPGLVREDGDLKFSRNPPIAKVRDLVLEARYVHHFHFYTRGWYGPRW